MTDEELRAIRERHDRAEAGSRERLRLGDAHLDRGCLLAEVDRLRTLINTPELHDFAKAVVLEALHQRERWGSDHDGGKTAEDWLWVLGHLAGKAVRSQNAGDVQKALHHTVTAAALLANWHTAITGGTNMRPGIEPPAWLNAQADVDNREGP